MALLSRAVKWFEPAGLLSRWQQATTPPRHQALPATIQKKFLALSCPPQPIDSQHPIYPTISAALDQWRQQRHGALALLGDFGAGKTILLRQIATTFKDLPLDYHCFTSRILGKTQLLEQLAMTLHQPPSRDVDDLATRLQAGPRRVVLLDDCHLLFLRRPGGFTALDQLVRLIRTTGRHILWITTWNVYAWIYLEHMYRLSDHFFQSSHIPPQPLSAMQQMLLNRAERVHLSLTWPPEETATLFRIIWTHARGRPLLAQHIFLRSLHLAHDQKYTLRPEMIYRLPQQCPIKDGEEAYALSSLVEHGTLTVQELANINHISESRAGAILARTTVNGLTLSREPDYRLNPIYCDALVAYLDSRRAIYFREVAAR